MAIYDFSKAPCGVTITNTSNKDMKISLSGHSQSFILTAGNSAILKAKTSSELIGYLSQLQDGIKVEFPGLPTSSDLPYTFTLLRAPIEWDLQSDILWPTQLIDAFDLGVPIEEGSFYKLSYQIEGESATDVTVYGERSDIDMPIVLLNIADRELGTFGKEIDVEEDYYFFVIQVMDASIEITEEGSIFTPLEPGHASCFIINGYTVEGIEGDPTNKNISILSFEKIADVMVPISITATGCTVSVVDNEDNVYGDGDSVKWGTSIHFVVTALQGYNQNAITFDSGVGYYDLSYTSEADRDITLIVSAALL